MSLSQILFINVNFAANRTACLMGGNNFVSAVHNERITHGQIAPALEDTDAFQAD